MKIETKFWCKLWREKRDIEECIPCPKRDDCNQSQKYDAGRYIRRMMLRVLIGAILISILIIGDWLLW